MLTMVSLTSLQDESQSGSKAKCVKKHIWVHAASPDAAKPGPPNSQKADLPFFVHGQFDLNLFWKANRTP